MTAATTRVGAYYDPSGAYAGVLFQGVEPNDPMSIGASDLWAVSTLSMKVPATMGRRLLGRDRTQPMSCGSWYGKRITSDTHRQFVTGLMAKAAAEARMRTSAWLEHPEQYEQRVPRRWVFIERYPLLATTLKVHQQIGLDRRVHPVPGGVPRRACPWWP